jgi:hypothetical protein
MIRPKRGSVGTIPLGDAVIAGLAQHFEEFPPATSISGVSGQQELLVFTDDKGNPIRRQRWNEIWNRAAKVAELPPVPPRTTLGTTRACSSRRARP